MVVDIAAFVVSVFGRSLRVCGALPLGPECVASTGLHTPPTKDAPRLCLRSKDITESACIYLPITALRHKPSNDHPLKLASTSLGACHPFSPVARPDMHDAANWPTHVVLSWSVVVVKLSLRCKPLFAVLADAPSPISIVVVGCDFSSQRRAIGSKFGGSLLHVPARNHATATAATATTTTNNIRSKHALEFG